MDRVSGTDVPCEINDLNSFQQQQRQMSQRFNGFANNSNLQMPPNTLDSSFWPPNGIPPNNGILPGDIPSTSTAPINSSISQTTQSSQNFSHDFSENDGGMNAMNPNMFQNFGPHFQHQMRMKQHGMPFPQGPGMPPNFMEQQMFHHHQLMLQRQQFAQIQANAITCANQMQSQNNAMSVSSPSITSSGDFMAPNSNNNTNNLNPGIEQQQQNIFQPGSNNSANINLINSASSVNNIAGMGSPTKNAEKNLSFSPNANGFSQQQFLEQQRMNMMNNNMTNGQNKRAYLFTSEMANTAVQDVHVLKKFDNMVQWHICNSQASTSNATNVSSTLQNTMSNNGTNNCVRPNSIDNFGINGNFVNSTSPAEMNNTSNNLAATSRASKRKTPHQTTSTPSPHHSLQSTATRGDGIINSNNVFSNLLDSSTGVLNPSITPSLNDSAQNGISSATTNSEFLRPTSNKSAGGNSVVNDMFGSSASNLKIPENDIGNPLKNMELMTNKHLSEPSAKMRRLSNDPTNVPAQTKLSDQKLKEQKLAKLENIEQILSSSFNPTGNQHSNFPMPPNNGGSMIFPHFMMMNGTQQSGTFNPQLNSQMTPQMLQMMRQHPEMFANGPPNCMPGNVPNPQAISQFSNENNAVGMPMNFMGNGNNGNLQDMAASSMMMPNNMTSNNFPPGMAPNVAAQQQMLMMMNNPRPGVAGNRQSTSSPTFMQNTGNNNGQGGITNNMNGSLPINMPMITSQQRMQMMQHHMMMQQQMALQQQQQQQNSPRFGSGIPTNSISPNAITSAQIEAMQKMRMANGCPPFNNPMDMAAMQQGMIRPMCGTNGEFPNMWPMQHQMPQSLANIDSRIPVQKLQYYGSNGTIQKPQQQS